MNRNRSQTVVLCAVLLLAACTKTVNSPHGFRLPPGNVDQGRVAFVELGCTQCHTVAADKLDRPGGEPLMTVKLGGGVTDVETYAELVTSIIYPSHAIKEGDSAKFKDEQGQTLMPDLTKAMTVRQMIDVTEYLQSHYTVVTPPYPDYPFAGSYYP
ncbi:c-type cytochrome [Pelagicoccus mobilis]|uniref:C-type cytochrome n=1 Tax=Pelagicoccus mobilis TaxID=415221 RepID=A0A934VN67_9BACT|nr:c-type cytochrome [Pelagicoccus mobilis]MBK1879606.1 c-type cytochrome [Pelagicoccus mobilis]